jgi:ketosteroid isomerase-like protein
VTTSANLDLVRSLFADWERGHFMSVGWADPEIEFVIVEGTAAGSWTGLAGMAEGFRNFLNAWDDLRVEAEQYRELDNERVLVSFLHVGRGKTSGLEIGQLQTKGATLFHIRDGTVTRLAIYSDAGRALSDLGLTPDTGT